jgi:hypothetical protein
MDLRLLSRRHHLGHPQVLHVRFLHQHIYCIRDQHGTYEGCIKLFGIAQRREREPFRYAIRVKIVHLEARTGYDLGQCWRPLPNQIRTTLRRSECIEFLTPTPMRGVILGHCC